MSKDLKVSATRINTFLQCKQKYWFNYVEKLPKIKNPAFKLGLAVHQSLELAGKIWMEKGEFSKKDIKIITDEYKKLSVSEGIDDPEIHKEGLDLVKKRLKNFLHGGKSVVGLEIAFGFSKSNNLVTPNGVPLIGSIDKVMEVDEDTLLIVDYKTSKTAPSPDQMKQDIQLSLYDLAASILWPEKRIIVSLDLLKHEVLYSYRTEEERSEFMDYLRFVYDGMLNLTEDQVTPTLNTFCGWCDFRDYCTEYKKACEGTDLKFLAVTSMDVEELVEEWKKMRSIKKIYDQREKELSGLILDKIKTEGKNIKTASEEVYIRQNSRKDYDMSVVSSVIPSQHLPNLVNINKKSLESYMDKNPAIKAKIMDNMNVGYTRPFLATKKIK